MVRVPTPTRLRGDASDTGGHGSRRSLGDALDSGIRNKGVLEHELSWAYHRMSRHARHRQEQMRFGDKKFLFWRDLRPPFSVLEVKRLEAKGDHPDGALHQVTYECAIDYLSERLWNMQKAGGTFDNKIHGLATVRIPERYPQQRPVTIVSWGKPCINWVQPGAVEIAPKIEIPQRRISEDLGLSTADLRPACKEATRRTKRFPQKTVEVPPLQKLLLGAHTSLPRLVEAENQRVRSLSLTDAVPGKRTRQHCVCTSAHGFVTYAG